MRNSSLVSLVVRYDELSRKALKTFGKELVAIIEEARALSEQFGDDAKLSVDVRKAIELADMRFAAAIGVE